MSPGGASGRNENYRSALEGVNGSVKVRLLILLIVTFQVLRVAGIDKSQVLSLRAKESLAAGDRALKQGDNKAAIKAFQEAIDLQPSFAPAYMNLGLAYYQDKDYIQSIKTLKRAVELDHKQEPASLFLGISYFQVGALDDSVKSLDAALALKPADPEVHRWLGRALLATGNYRQAILHLSEAVRLFPEEASLQYSLGQAHMQLAQQIFENLYKKDPNTPLMHFFLGKTFMDQEKPDRAIVEFETVLKLDRTFPGANEALSDISRKSGKLGQAEDQLRKELAVNPYNHRATCKLGSVLTQLNKADEAVPLLQDMVLLDPKLFCGQFELGHALFVQKKFTEAIRHLEMATNMDTKYAPTYYLLGRAYAKIGALDKSQAAFKLVRALQDKNMQQIRDNLGASEALEEQARPAD
jgi:tetratricopeptide (TPR) repeat protein